MEDDRKPVETPSRSAVSRRRGWHHAAAFAAQVLEVVPKTKNGYDHIGTPCKAVTEAHHIWSAQRQDFLGPPISRTSVSCAPRGCDRDHDRSESGCTAMRIANPAHSPLLIHQTCLKPHILHYFSLPRDRSLFTGLGASAAAVALLRGSRNDCGLRIIVPPSPTRSLRRPRYNKDRPFSACVTMLAPHMAFCFAMPTT
ncbi:hypothetical protein GGD66_002599 [Bradyrhizobium sp. CIR48]|nr:hypothetical protein [Bradyrhizobium sp. CIR48]